MFEEYLQDSYEFFEIAKNAESDREARRYFRASAFYASGAIEAFTNYIADSFAKAESLEPYEIAFLNDKILIFDPKKGQRVEKTEYHRLDEKLKVLINRFVPDFDFTEKAWSWLMEFKDFRDSLVHPRQNDDETTTSEYQAKMKRGLSGIIEIMNHISSGMFGKPLRKKILDLIPE
jgi:hypothetical protein